MPITAVLHGSPPRGSPTSRPSSPVRNEQRTTFTTSQQSWLSVENARLHREVARLNRALDAHEGPTLMEVQMQNARLEREVQRLQQQVERMRKERTATAETVAVQCSLGWASNAVGWVKPPPKAPRQRQGQKAKQDHDLRQLRAPRTHAAGIFYAPTEPTGVGFFMTPPARLSLTELRFLPCSERA